MKNDGYATEFNYEYAKSKIRKDYGEEFGNFLIELSESFIPEKPYPEKIKWEMKCLELFIVRKYYENMYKVEENK